MGSELFQFLRGKTDITLTNPIQYLFKNPSPSFNALFSRGNEISGKVACEISVVSTIDHPRMPISFYFRLNEIGPRKSIFTRRHKEFQLKVPLPSSRQVNPRNLAPIVPADIYRGRRNIPNIGSNKGNRLELRRIEGGGGGGELVSFEAFQISMKKLFPFDYFSSIDSSTKNKHGKGCCIWQNYLRQNYLKKFLFRILFRRVNYTDIETIDIARNWLKIEPRIAILIGLFTGSAKRNNKKVIWQNYDAIYVQNY